MNYDIATEYISFSKKSIKKYLKLIMDHYFDEDIYDDLINAYINTRYYNLYPHVSKRFEENIVYYLKKSLQDINKDDTKLKEKAKFMFRMFKYVLSFDGVVETDSARKIINEIKDIRLNDYNLIDPEFESKLYFMLEEDLLAKKDFLESFDDKNFTMNYIKVREHTFYCILDHNIKFSKLYSEYAIAKVFNSKSVSEQKLFVTYPVVGVKALLDIIKGDFERKYIVDYVFSITEKPKKNKRLLRYINNDVIKEKIILSVEYLDYKANPEKVYELTREGFKIALKIDNEFVINEETEKLVKLFELLITDDQSIVDKFKDRLNILLITNS